MYYIGLALMKSLINNHTFDLDTPLLDVIVKTKNILDTMEFQDE